MTHPITLFSAHLDGYSLSSSESTQLSNWVSAAPANARAVVQLSRIHECLDSRMCLPEMLEDLAHAEDPELRQEITQSLDALWSTIEDSPCVEPVRPPKRSSFTTTKAAAAALAACLAIGLGVFLLAGPAGKQDVAVGPIVPIPSAPVATESTDTPAEVTPSPVGPADPPTEPAVVQVATVETAIDAVWSNGQTPQVGDILQPGDAINLDLGVVQVRTSEGHTLVFEAPVQGALESGHRVHLTSGRVSGLVGKQRDGLEFITPSAHVIDLGTELGVGVDEQGNTAVAVYDGAVEIQNEEGAKATLQAGLETQVSFAGNLDAPRRSPHDRAFIRTDEVELLVASEAGQEQAASLAAYYALLRSESLLAYQSFDKNSRGEDYSFGFSKPALRTAGSYSLVRDLTLAEEATSGALFLREPTHVFLDIDNTPTGPFAAAQLLNDQRLVSGQSELWIAWREQSHRSLLTEHFFAGLSLTADDADDSSDFFIGRVHKLNVYGVQVNAGVDSREKHPFDFSGGIGNPSHRDADGEVHQFIIQIRFAGEGGNVRLWFDTPVDSVTNETPLLNLDVEQLAFDRLRFAIGDASVAWMFDDVMIATSAENLAVATEVLTNPPVDRVASPD